MRVLVIDTKNHGLKSRNVSRNGQQQCLAGSRVIAPCDVRNRLAILICPNHSSGDLAPSQEDLAITEQLALAGKSLDIKLVDHLIIGNGKYISLKGKLRW